MDAQEAVLRAQIPGHVHEWHPSAIARALGGTADYCACGDQRHVTREHPFGVVIPDPDSKEQA